MKLFKQQQSKTKRMDQRVYEALMESYRVRGRESNRLEDTEEELNERKEVQAQLRTLFDDSTVLPEHASIIGGEILNWSIHEMYLHDTRERHRRNRERITKELDELLATKSEEDYAILERQPSQAGVSPDHILKELDKFLEEKETTSLMDRPLVKKLMAEFAIKQILAHIDSL